MKRKNIRSRVLPVAMLAGLAAGGCGQDVSAPQTPPPIRAWKPIGEQAIDLDPGLRDTPFRVLLGFETANDLVFVNGGGALTRDEKIFHSGPASLLLSAGSKSLSIKLASLIAQPSFPGSWTLLGSYFYAGAAVRIQVSYEAAGKTLATRSVAVPPRTWTPVLLDLSPLTDPNSPPPPAPGLLRFVLEGPAQAVWCDDVIVVDNDRTLVTGSLPGDGWSVRVRGFETILDRPGHFTLTVKTPDVAAEGWRLVEANELRARFTASEGKRSWVVYAGGCQSLDGVFSLPASAGVADRTALAEQHASPAETSVPEGMGRVERNSPGDRDNDGYNELTAAYQFKASGSRIVISLRPHTPRLVRPMLEIAGLPRGQISGVFEGILVDKSVRLPDGHVLVELPGVIDREVTVELKVR